MTIPDPLPDPLVPIDPDTSCADTGSQKSISDSFLNPLMVFVGGFLGTISRYLVSKTFLVANISWPYPLYLPTGTFMVNAIGAFILGAFLESLSVHSLTSDKWQKIRFFIATGWCGSFTTYSTFVAETVSVGKTNHIVWGLIYAVISIFVGIFSCYGGIFFARKITTAFRGKP